MINLNYPQIRPQSFYYPANSMQYLPNNIPNRPISEKPNIKNSSFNLSTHYNPKTKMEGGFLLNSVKQNAPILN